MDKNVIAEMTSEEFERFIEDTDIVIFPVGATEAYGYHLPMGSDWLVTYDVAKRIAKKVDCFVAPPVTYGFSEDLMCFKGTISISTSSIISFYGDVVESFYRQGIKKILFMCGHIGNIGAIDQVACDVMQKYDMKCAIVDWWRFVNSINAELLESKFPEGHAAEGGTSVLKYLFPELVIEEKMVLNEKEDTDEIPELYVYEYFDKEAPASVLGNPFAGSCEKGEKMVEKAIGVIGEFIKGWK